MATWPKHQGGLGKFMTGTGNIANSILASWRTWRRGCGWRIGTSLAGSLTWRVWWTTCRDGGGFIARVFKSCQHVDGIPRVGYGLRGNNWPRRSAGTFTKSKRRLHHNNNCTITSMWRNLVPQGKKLEPQLSTFSKAAAISLPKIPQHHVRDLRVTKSTKHTVAS